MSPKVEQARILCLQAIGQVMALTMVRIPDTQEEIAHLETIKLIKNNLLNAVKALKESEATDTALKIWEQDHGWAGMLIAVAETEEEARNLLKGAHTYEADKPVHPQEIVKGLTFFNYGDI